MGAGLAQWNISRYDPVIGRFMAVDPVEPDPERNVHTLNRYAYANNNPYKYVDPDGRFAVMATIAIATIAYSAYQGYQDGGATGALAEASGYNDAVASYNSFMAGDYSGAILAAGMATIKPLKAVKNAENAADAALSAGKKSGAAAELHVGGRVFTAVSGEKVPHNPQVTGALMGTSRSARKPWHGGCAEIACLDKALNAGVDPSGGSIRAVNIGISGSGHGTPKQICSSCKDVLNHFGVND